jgi:hypothetical protein
MYLLEELVILLEVKISRGILALEDFRERIMLVTAARKGPGPDLGKWRETEGIGGADSGTAKQVAHRRRVTEIQPK